MSAGSGVPRVVAIDGPSGAGKSTVARAVAGILDLEVLDTGAMYRAVTAVVLARGVDPTDPEGCTAVAETMELEITDRVVVHEGGTSWDLTAEIRGPAVTAVVSKVSAHPGVRTELVARQRSWVAARDGGVVEGRDIGTVVFPDAPVKVYLTASDEERARRRQRDESAAARTVELEQVREDLGRRDQLDSSRSHSPLVAAPDALHVDTTQRPPDDVAREIAQRFHAALERPGA